MIWSWSSVCDFWFVWCLWLQPHGFFNCSPAVDVPPSACELEAKDNDVKDNGVAKSIPNGLLAAKLWSRKRKRKKNCHLSLPIHFNRSFWKQVYYSHFQFQLGAQKTHGLCLVFFCYSDTLSVNRARFLVVFLFIFKIVFRFLTF